MVFVSHACAMPLLNFFAAGNKKTTTAAAGAEGSPLCSIREVPRLCNPNSVSPSQASVPCCRNYTSPANNATVHALHNRSATSTCSSPLALSNVFSFWLRAFPFLFLFFRRMSVLAQSPFVFRSSLYIKKNLSNILANWRKQECSRTTCPTAASPEHLFVRLLVLNWTSQAVRDGKTHTRTEKKEVCRRECVQERRLSRTEKGRDGGA
uniref:Uncharacterized protein n=1 Tax=Trypanosoma vivax (strain Y486) TaxID=1055687 RepID=G0TVP5_TRYVY|nr:hypothetical protein, unlikely [Trypanosoma vivax Y486]